MRAIGRAGDVRDVARVADDVAGALLREGERGVGDVIDVGGRHAGAAEDELQRAVREAAVVLDPAEALLGGGGHQAAVDDHTDGALVHDGR